MLLYLKRAIADTFSNGFLSMITIMTMALSILVVSTVVFVFENGERLMSSWTDSIRIMAYLKPGVEPGDLPSLEALASSLDHVNDIRFISRESALSRLKKEMKPGHLFLEGLEENPLPHSLEVVLNDDVKKWETIEAVAAQVRDVDGVDDVEYGQQWRGRFFKLFRLFKMTGYAMAGLFCLVALFITSNTVRLALYARRQEVDTMRMVGATDRFIRMPFYIAGLLQGTFGGILGVGLLAGLYIVISTGLSDSIPAYALFGIQFVSPGYCCGIIVFSSLLGFSGCYLSLKHYLK